MSSSLSTLVIFLFWVALGAADNGNGNDNNSDNHGVTFLYPTSNLTFNYKDTVRVSYTSSFNAPQLFTFCTAQGSSNIITELVQASIPAQNGTSLVTLTWPDVSTCWFDLRPNSSAGHGANSPSFTLLSTAHSPAQTFSLEHPHGNPSNQHAPHKAIIIAIIAAAILITSILGLLAFICWRRRQAKRKGYIRTNVLQAQYIDQVDQKWHPGGGGAAGEYVYVKPMQSYGEINKDKKTQRPAELPVDERPVELSSYPSPTVQPSREGQRYEPRRYEVPAVEPVLTPKRQKRFSWQPGFG